VRGWDQKSLSDFAARWNRGDTIAEIAVAFRVEPRWVCTVRKRLALPTRRGTDGRYRGSRYGVHRRQEKKEMSDNKSTPDFIYDPDEWEFTFTWADRSDLMESIDLGEIKQFDTLIKGPPKWAAHVILTCDEEGDPDETELRWFDTYEEARAALNPEPPPET